MEKNSKFQAFLDEVQEELIIKKHRQKDLDSYLITPIQRLPRYKLLLTVKILLFNKRILLKIQKKEHLVTNY
jgi:hypothetical protein